MKHTWALNEYGEIDDFGYDEGMCNGPRCTACLDGFCKHCAAVDGETYEELLNRDDCEGE